MENYKKGFVIPLVIAIVALLGIGGGAYVYVNKKTISTNIENKKNNVDEEIKICDSVISEESLLCGLNNAYINNSTPVLIRHQANLSDYYNNNKQDTKLLLREIENRSRNIKYRTYLIKILSIDDNNFALFRKDLLNIISNNKNEKEIRIEMINTLPKIYYSVFHKTRITDNDDLFNTMTSILRENDDELSLAVINSMFGQLASLDLNRSVKIITDFPIDYKNKYLKTPNSLINALLILKRTNKLDLTSRQAMEYVCAKNDPRKIPLCTVNERHP